MRSAIVVAITALLGPASYAATSRDGNDASAQVNPGTAEVCNGIDDDGDGTVDNVAPPGPVTSLTVGSGMPAAQWDADSVAQAYDVVYGDLAELASTGGDFTVATRGCLAYNTTATSASSGPLPSAGEGSWILVRAKSCGGAGTYDSGDPVQVGMRDAEIEASPLSCRPFCGDGVCSTSEDCSLCWFDCGPCLCTVDAECQPASCCHPVSCITIWEPQSCDDPTCDDGCQICLSACLCQEGACVAIF